MITKPNHYMSVNFHFLNAGSGDCTIVHFPVRTRKDGKEKNERIMMVDLNHHNDHGEYENVIDYYKSNFRNPDNTVKPIFRFVSSHPHQDHICGLKELLDDEHIRILNFWDLNHSFEPEDFEHHPTHKEDWAAYKRLGAKDSPATVIRVIREDSPKEFWDDDEDRISVLSPSQSLVHYAHYKEDGSKRDKVEIDEMAYALMIKINQRKIILASDGRVTPFWDDIYEHCKSDLRDCAILKAGHHGHESSFHKEAVKLMNPESIIFSNSQEADQSDGAEDLYKKAVPNATIRKTHEEGTIVASVPFGSTETIMYSTSP